nr:hypothetical protein [Tanacetum cinerariifolium]
SRIEYSDAQSIGSLTGVDKDEDVQSHRNKEPEIARLIDEVWPVDQIEAVKIKHVDVVNTQRSLEGQIKNHNAHQLGVMDITEKDTIKSNNTPRAVGNGTSRNPCVRGNPSGDLTHTCEFVRLVRDLEDDVQELWRIRDKLNFSEDDEPPLKKEYGHSLKFFLKGIVDQSPKKNKDHEEILKQ